MMFNPMMQMMANMMNPQQILNRFLQGVPAEIRNNPDQVLNWMRQNGMVSEEQIRQARQMMGQQMTGK